MGAMTDYIMRLTLLFLSLVCSTIGIFSAKRHIKLAEELDKNAFNVDYIDFLVSAYGAYLLLPVSVVCVVVTIWLLLAN